MVYLIYIYTIINKASQSDLEVERARINSFTSLNEGSTTGE